MGTVVAKDRSFGQSCVHLACIACLLQMGAARAQEVPAAGSVSEPVPATTPATPLETVVVRGQRIIEVGPMPGLALTRDQIPANLQSATRAQLRDARALSIGDYMNSRMQGVSVNDYAGNPFQIDVNYRGFTASPQVGTPQGLSVFFDGMRVNEAFGDVVNWDLIPMNAIQAFDLFPGSNPLFGLNTLGGALSVRSKSGFTAPGVEASVQAGSFGRRHTQLAVGGNNDTLAGFAAVNVFDEDGWRDDSPSRVRQFFGRGDWGLSTGTLTATVLAADNVLVGNGLVPQELVAQRPEGVFTSPDESRNRLAQFSLSGLFDVSATNNITFRATHRRSDRDGLNGDIYEGFDDFSSTQGLDVVIDRSRPIGEQLVTRNGAKQFGPGGALLPGATGVVEGTPIGLLTNTALEQSTDSLALQFNANLPTHKFMLGASVDRSRSTYLMSQRLGLIDADRRVYGDADAIDPIYYAAANDVPGNNFNGTQTTASLYLSDTWSARPNLHVTTAARYNHTRTDSELFTRASAAQRDLHELRTSNPDIDALVNAGERTAEIFTYRSLNPSLGVNWLPEPSLNLYGNLSGGTRVPSVVELGCAFDDTPVELINGDVSLGTVPRSLLGAGCSLPNTLSGDPYLPQIRSVSAEAGARGQLAQAWLGWKSVQWNASVYRTDLRDDIYFVGVGDGKSYFDTVGRTRRQGFELGLSGQLGAFDVSMNYAYTEATFESTLYTISPQNSSADFDQNSQSFGNRPDLGNVDTLPSPTAQANGGRGTYRMIRIDPGSRLPGVPAHAFSANLAWRPVAAWKLGLGLIVRSSSYVRGNENNQHRPGGTDQETGLYFCPGEICQGFEQLPVRPGRTFNTSGKTGGYAILNLDLSWQATRQLGVFLQVNNVFDRRYASAGRLGVNPFSPSTNGAIGPSGWNYNSAEWGNTTNLGPGAPRGIWIGLSYDLPTL